MVIEEEEEEREAVTNGRPSKDRDSPKWPTPVLAEANQSNSKDKLTGFTEDKSSQLKYDDFNQPNEMTSLRIPSNQNLYNKNDG